MIQAFDSGGWPQWVYRVRKLHRLAASQDPMLIKSWERFKTDYLETDNGEQRVVDPATRNTSSTAQAAAMLRAVYIGDRATFDALWAWAQRNLQTRDDTLLARQWGTRADGATGTVDRETMTEAGTRMLPRHSFSRPSAGMIEKASICGAPKR